MCSVVVVIQCLCDGGNFMHRYRCNFSWFLGVVV